jgi:CAAX protease family protein
MSKQRFIVLSPVLVILLGTLTIRVAQRLLGVWAWVPWILVYWASIGFLVIWGSEREAVKRWMDRPQGNWLWSALAILLALPSGYMFLSSWQVLRPLVVWLPWLIVGLVNPVLEEGYWRGLLLDKTSAWPGWISVLGSSLLFMLNHLLGIGVTSTGGRHPVLLINALVFGLVFGLIYKKTSSLRWLVIAHALTDLLGLSVAVFLNLWVPPM